MEQLESDFAKELDEKPKISDPCVSTDLKLLSRKMSREELLMLHKKLCMEARELMTKKNHDYAAETDLFRNFRRHGRFGIVVRLDDKLARLQSFLENGGKFEVTTETLQDTIIDIINYAVLFAAYQE